MFLLLIFLTNVNAETLLKKIEAANIIVYYPQEILIERGWTNFVTFSVNNSGEVILYNVNALVEGDYPNWFEFQNNKIDIIPVNKKIDFVTKISIPAGTSIGSYSFSLKINSDEINYVTDFIVRVFENRDDLLLYQIQILRNNLTELQNKVDSAESLGVNLTSARELLLQIKSELSAAEEEVHNKMYTQVTETIRDVQKLFIEARFEASNPPRPIETKSSQTFDISSKDVFFMSLGIGIIVLLAALIFLVRKIKIENKIRLPNLRLRELIVENKRLKEVEQEIEKIKEAQSIIEEESKENMISKESYDELRVKYQEKLLELESERRKVRGY